MQRTQWIGTYQWMGVDGFAALWMAQDTASTFAALRLVAGGYLLLDGFAALWVAHYTASSLPRCGFVAGGYLLLDGFAALWVAHYTASSLPRCGFVAGGYLLLDGFAAPTVHRTAVGCCGACLPIQVILGNVVLRCMLANTGDFGERRVTVHACQYR